jgi:hypothetical protein
MHGMINQAPLGFEQIAFQAKIRYRRCNREDSNRDVGDRARYSRYILLFRYVSAWFYPSWAPMSALGRKTRNVKRW